MAESDVVRVLEQIQKDQSAIHITVTEIKGENKLQSQVLSFHIEQLKEFKLEIVKLIDEQNDRMKKVEERVDKLERWQLKLVAIASAAASIATLFFTDIKAFLSK